MDVKGEISKSDGSPRLGQPLSFAEATSISTPDLDRIGEARESHICPKKFKMAGLKKPLGVKRVRLLLLTFLGVSNLGVCLINFPQAFEFVRRILCLSGPGLPSLLEREKRYDVAI